MKVLRGQKHDEFQPLDADEDCEVRTTSVDDGKEQKTTKKTRKKKSQSNKDKGAKKFVAKRIVKGSSKSKYSYLDGSFPMAESSDETREANEDNFDSEFVFRAVFNDVRQDINKNDDDYSFDAVFDKGVSESEPNNADTSVELMSKLKSAPGYSTDATSTCGTSCAASSQSSLRVSDVFDSDVASRVSFFERSNTFPFQDDISTSSTSSNDDRDATKDEKSITSNPSQTPRPASCNSKSLFNLGGGSNDKTSDYEKHDCPPATQAELDERLRAIKNLKDITIQQGKKIRMIQLSNKAYRIRVKLFHKEVACLQTQNADLKHLMTSLENDLRVAKTGAVVSEGDVNGLRSPLVLIRQETSEVESRAKSLDTIGDLLAEHNLSNDGKQDASATISEDTSSFSFDAFNLNQGNRSEISIKKELGDCASTTANTEENQCDSRTAETFSDTHEEGERENSPSSGQEEEELRQENVGMKKESHITLEERVNFFPFIGW